MEEKAYMIKYDEFLGKYSSGDTSGEEVGKIIAELAQEFARYNMILSEREKALSRLAAEKVSATDETTGKPISVSKADIMIKATDEYEAVNEVKTDLENIDNYINALKYLQRGINNEYSHMGNT